MELKLLASDTLIRQGQSQRPGFSPLTTGAMSHAGFLWAGTTHLPWLSPPQVPVVPTSEQARLRSTGRTSICLPLVSISEAMARCA